jgi:hypothetical protein
MLLLPPLLLLDTGLCPAPLLLPTLGQGLGLLLPASAGVVLTAAGLGAGCWWWRSCSAVALLRAGTKGLVTASLGRCVSAASSCCWVGKGGCTEAGCDPLWRQCGQVSEVAVAMACWGVVR